MHSCAKDQSDSSILRYDQSGIVAIILAFEKYVQSSVQSTATRCRRYCQSVILLMLKEDWITYMHTCTVLGLRIEGNPHFSQQMPVRHKVDAPTQVSTGSSSQEGLKLHLKSQVRVRAGTVSCDFFDSTGLCHVTVLVHYFFNITALQ